MTHWQNQSWWSPESLSYEDRSDKNVKWAWVIGANSSSHQEKGKTVSKHGNICGLRKKCKVCPASDRTQWPFPYWHQSLSFPQSIEWDPEEVWQGQAALQGKLAALHIPIFPFLQRAPSSWNYKTCKLGENWEVIQCSSVRTLEWVSLVPQSPWGCTWTLCITFFLGGSP